MSSHAGLIANGHVWTGNGRCKKCGGVVLWYRTPNQKHEPFDPKTFARHFTTCGQAERNELKAQAERELAEQAEQERIELERKEEQKKSGMLNLDKRRAISFDDPESTPRPQKKAPTYALPEKKLAAAKEIPGQCMFDFDAAEEP